MKTDTPPTKTEAMILPIELALIRWSVVSMRWNELSTSNAPLLTAFLAGWCCRCVGATFPDNPRTFRDSFRVGWREAEDQIIIASRENKTKGEEKETDGGSLAAKCLNPGCSRAPMRRGLCDSCYHIAHKLVRCEVTTWKRLAEEGKILPPKKGHTQEWLLASSGQALSEEARNKET